MQDELESSRSAAGSLKLLNLEKVRERMGDEWESVEPRIHKHIKLLLDMRLGPGDRYFRHDHAQYFIMFGSEESATAEEKMDALANEVVTKVLGTSALQGDLGIGASVTDLEDVFRTGFMTNLSECFETAEEVRHESAVSGASDAADWFDQFRGLIREAEAELDELLREGNRSAQAALREASLLKIIATAKRELAARDEEAKTQAAAADIRPDAGPDGGAGETPLPGVSEEDNAKLFDLLDSIVPSPKGLRFEYLPVWSTTRGVISVFGCQAVLDYASSSMPLANLKALEGMADHLLLIDCITLKRALVDLQEMERNSDVVMISVPVHLPTLTRTSSVASYLGICRSVAEKLRRLLVWEILGADDHSWSSHLAKRAAQLIPYGRGVSFRIPAGRISLNGLTGRGFLGVSTVADGRYENTVENLEKLCDFAERAAAAKLQSNVWDVHDPELARRLIAFGVDNLRGNVVGAPQPKPSPMARLDIEAVTGSPEETVVAG
ncbi:MAG: hypothetical protein MI755_01355 [Sphingomonadales bacterium]|nr:hypothetical protein [Sphingomonadales bacterium]